MHKQNFIKIHSLFLKIEILTSIKGHNSVEKFRKIYVLVAILHTQNFIKIHQFVPQDIKWKQNSDINQGQ